MTKEFGKRAQLLQTKIWILDNGQIVNAVLQFSMTLVHSLEIDLWILNCQGTISEDLLAKPYERNAIKQIITKFRIEQNQQQQSKAVLRA
ncbi:hypothetical protein OIU79_003787 [Salix purpurea]|uniref:Uncharacterized protein n=1 Tax=Salix purpurea TaxID=77065 RepID=A0A9Q0U8S3_SALPP|nr:hypothetical protein OIU79_003787 [Salix purpurea]